MDWNARVDVNFFRVDVDCHCDLILQQIFFILISINIKVLLILHTQFQLNITSRSGENVDFISYAIFFSICGHSEFSTRLSFTVLMSCCLIMLHMKFEIHGCSGLRDAMVYKNKSFEWT